MSGEADLGRLIGDRYLLERVLGQGGMATVFLARDTKLDRAVAIKLLHTELAEQAAFRTRFRQEAHAAARINHPSIVRVFDAGEDSNNGRTLPYLVMEYVDGELLSALIAGGPLSQADALHVMGGILTALEYSHRAGVVHRDIKPGNIMVLADGSVKVMDFGIAHAVTEATASVAQTTAILGTAAYFSPEQARGEVVDERSDLYSAGVVLFEMLTGRVPFIADSPVRVAYQHLSEPPVAPSSLNSAVSPEVDALVAHALTKSKLGRYTTAEEFRADVEKAAAGIMPVLPQPSDTELLLTEVDTLELSPQELMLRQLAESGVEVRVTRRPPTGWLWAGGTLILALAAAVLFWAMNLAPSDELPSAQRQVPQLTNMSQADAIAALDKLDLGNQVFQVSDNTIQTGNVVRTDPQAGEVVTAKTTISLYVSTGKAVLSVPNLTNQTLAQAQATLTAAGFVPGVQNQVDSPTIPAGMIISTDPVVGTAVPVGSTINLNVSTGQVKVPSVLGQPISQATLTLTGDALRLTVNPIGDTSCPTAPGQPITAQSVGPGEVPQGSSVDLHFCAG